MSPQRVTAGQVRKGDVLWHDGQEIVVLADPQGAVFLREGHRMQGIAIDCRAPSAYPGGTATWTLYRQGSEVLYRVGAQ